MTPVLRYSSRRQRLDRSFLAYRLQGARSYDRIAGYFSSSLLEVVGEELESVIGKIRVICNSDLTIEEVQTAKAAQNAMWKSWAGSQPEARLDEAAQQSNIEPARRRFRRLYEFLSSGKMEVRVLPDEVFGLIHGKAGVITLADGTQTSFMGSVNETQAAWQINYELVWEDPSPEAIYWVQEEFDALWGHPQAVPLSQAVIQDVQRLAERRVFHTVEEWAKEGEQAAPDPAPVIIETPVYRQEVGLWQHQKYFVKTVFDAHCGPTGRARYVLADQVGLGKTIQLAMAAQLIALTGTKPILVICPKTLVWQWRDEMKDMLDMPSAVWNGRTWVNEQDLEYPYAGVEAIRQCPRRVGIVSSGLISRKSEAAIHLLKLNYDCVILDEAHRARRRNLGPSHDNESPQPNNLLSFMYQIAERTRSLLLATATPVQLRPVEAWDLLDILSRGDEAVLGNDYSRWRNAPVALNLLMGVDNLPTSEVEQWEWICNPLPPKTEGQDFEILRRNLNITDAQSVLAGSRFDDLRAPDRTRIHRIFPKLITAHNPFIRRIVRRTRTQLEQQRDPITMEPLLRPIQVELLGEEKADAIRLPGPLRDAYDQAEEFCSTLSQRMKGAGFLKTLLLRRVGSSIFAGLETAKRMLKDWGELESDEEDAEDEAYEATEPNEAALSRLLTAEERNLLDRFIHTLETFDAPDPKFAVVLRCLKEWHWLEKGCIIFSQYYDSINWLAEKLTQEFPEEMIAIYSGPNRSGFILNGQRIPATRDHIKALVRKGEIRLMLGTDAASEGLNLQRLATLINLDLPWNPTRLEQRKGRIQRIGQQHDVVQIYNMRYQESVEDRVHELLSSRLQDIHALFGQIPDVLEDAWVKVAQGEIDEARKIIGALPRLHPFDIRYTQVETVDWETCSTVLAASEKRRVLSQEWGDR